MIEILGRHSDRLTECQMCNLGQFNQDTQECELCPANEYGFKNKYELTECLECPEHTFSVKGSVGPESCIQKRPCTVGDYLITESEECVEGKKTQHYQWADHDNDGNIDCDPSHEKSKSLKESMQVDCDPCTKGQSRSKDGKCHYCPTGTFQPEDLGKVGSK